MSGSPSQRLEDAKGQVHALGVETGMSSWQASRLASLVELIARLVLTEDKLRGQS